MLRLLQLEHLKWKLAQQPDELLFSSPGDDGKLSRNSAQSGLLLMRKVGWLLLTFSQLGTKANPVTTSSGMKVEVGVKTSSSQLMKLDHKTLQLCVKHVTLNNEFYQIGRLML